jgi:hypothetical protein
VVLNIANLGSPQLFRPLLGPLCTLNFVVALQGDLSSVSVPVSLASNSVQPKMFVLCLSRAGHSQSLLWHEDSSSEHM